MADFKVVALGRDAGGRDVAWLEGLLDAVDVRALSKVVSIGTEAS